MNEPGNLIGPSLDKLALLLHGTHGSAISVGTMQHYRNMNYQYLINQLISNQ